MLKALPIVLVLLLSGVSAWGGNESGGGGTYVLVDGQLLVADPFFREVSPEDARPAPPNRLVDVPVRGFSELPADLKFEVIGLLDFMHDMGLKVGPLEHRVRSSKAYVLVPRDQEDGAPCTFYLPLLSRPVQEHFAYGCTFQQSTFLLWDRFRRAEIDQQALGILHERLWALTYTANQRDVADLVALTAKLRAWARAQKHGELRELPEGALAKIRRFHEAAGALGIESIYGRGKRVVIETDGTLVDLRCVGKPTEGRRGLGIWISQCPASL